MSIDDDCRRLISLLTHEIRSPGAVVSGYLRMLRAPAASEPTREQKMIEEANKSCGRLMHIVQELSDFGELSSSAQDLPLVRLPIFALCDDVAQAASNEGADVAFVCDEQ